MTAPGGIVWEIKPGAELHKLEPQTVLALQIAASYFAQVTGIFTVTSVCDQPWAHGPKSKHHQGFAADIRTRHLTDEIAEQLAESVALALGDGYDVLLKTTPGNKHLHIEYDPWRPAGSPPK